MILLVEDDAINRMAMGDALRSSQIDVVEAKDGDQALQLLSNHPDIKLVVMDFVLPGLDGLKLMDLIHQHRPRLPTVLVSGYLSQKAGDAIVGRSSGRRKYLAKPFHPSALVRTVQELLAA
jgi:CheY-like chemotaxis protein